MKNVDRLIELLEELEVILSEADYDNLDNMIHSKYSHFLTFDYGAKNSNLSLLNIDKEYKELIRILELIKEEIK